MLLIANDCSSSFHPADLISITVNMILRVYAMWNRSKWILYLLLFIYVPQVIITIVFAGIYNTSRYLSGMSRMNFTCRSNLTQVALHLWPPFSPVTIVQITDFSFCDASTNNTPYFVGVVNLGPRLILGATLLILAVAQTLKQSVNMYKAKQQWQPNRFMERLVRDGILYFLVYVLVSPSPSFPFVQTN